MSTYTDHRDAAVDLLTEAERARPEVRPEMIATAQVHATLALAAANAGDGGTCASCEEFHLDDVTRVIRSAPASTG